MTKPKMTADQIAQPILENPTTKALTDFTVEAFSGIQATQKEMVTLLEKLHQLDHRHTTAVSYLRDHELGYAHDVYQKVAESADTLIPEFNKASIALAQTVADTHEYLRAARKILYYLGPNSGTINPDAYSIFCEETAPSLTKAYNESYLTNVHADIKKDVLRKLSNDAKIMTQHTAELIK